MLEAMDRLIMRAMRTAGLDTFDAEFNGAGDPVSCTVMRDTLELANEYGITVTQSGAVVHYLASELSDVRLGDAFEFDGKRYTVENRIPTQDSHWRTVHCRVGEIND